MIYKYILLHKFLIFLDFIQFHQGEFYQTHLHHVN